MTKKYSVQLIVFVSHFHTSADTICFCNCSTYHNFFNLLK